MTGQKDAAKITKAAMTDRLWDVLQAENHDAQWASHATRVPFSRERVNGNARECGLCRCVVRQFSQVTRGVEFRQRSTGGAQ
jgi:hypothetical protein